MTHEDKIIEEWEQIKYKYSQSGWFDNINEIEELDQDIANMLTTRRAQVLEEVKEKIGGVPNHIIVPTQWDTSATYAAYEAGAKDRHQRIFDILKHPTTNKQST